MNYVKIMFNKLIMILFIFIKDLKKKIEENNECYFNGMYFVFLSN